jgi:hypothetical protein
VDRDTRKLRATNHILLCDTLFAVC